MRGRQLLAVLTTAGCTGLAVAPAAGTQPATATVSLRVGFDAHARLGGTTALTFDLRIDAHREPAPMTGVTILAADGIDVGTSGLGLATCRPAQRDLRDVLARGHDLRPCPANALLGQGDATAAIYYPSKTVAATGSVAVSNGPPVGDHLGVVAYVHTHHPIRSQLVYVGQITGAPRPFGLTIQIGLPAIPDSPFGAPVSLRHLAFTLGGKDIIYHELVHGRRRAYHPGGLPLPTACPRGGFRFRATVAFADGSSRSGGTAVPCPTR